MDGFKKHLRESIQLKLLATLSLAILVVAAIAGWVSFASSFHDANELQDDTLREIASLFDHQHLPLDLARPVNHRDDDEDARVIVQRLDGRSDPNSALVPLLLPATLGNGMHTLDLGSHQFRVLVRTSAIGERIAVAQETTFRDESARDNALRTVMPLLFLVPVLLVVIASLVRKSFRPIAALSTEIDQRDAQDLHAIEEDRLPTEVRPFAVAINRMLSRIGHSMESQRRFVADAAHELRSPLTALSLQAERLAETCMPDPARERLGALRLGIERSRNLLDQLLKMARAQTTHSLPISSTSAQIVFRRVLEDLLPLAEAKHIDIGVEGTGDALVRANESDLVVLFSNLVDNAIRYTPEGGRIDLSIDLSVVAENGFAALEVRDSGPGIPIAERERVFDPFYRILGSEEEGSGLGLAIVKAISDKIGAHVQLAFGDETKQSGLRVRVLIPLSK